MHAHDAASENERTRVVLDEGRKMLAQDRNDHARNTDDTSPRPGLRRAEQATGTAESQTAWRWVSGAALEHEVERCLRGPAERAEPGLVGNLAEPGFARLRAQGRADLLG